MVNLPKYLQTNLSKQLLHVKQKNKKNFIWLCMVFVFIQNIIRRLKNTVEALW